MIVVRSEEGSSLCAKLCVVGPPAHTWEGHLCVFPHFIFEVSIDWLAPALLNQLNEVAELASDTFKHWYGHVLPPLLRLKIEDQDHLSLDYRDRALFLKQPCNFHYLVSQTFEDELGS